MITVFTPTYNRASLISRLYNSLLDQTSKNFEWIVVDDGSVDNTEQLFKDILSRENPFVIKYIKQENGGKHRAINQGVKIASGNMFFIVDSDDYLVNNAIEKILDWEKYLDDSKKWAGVSGLKGYDKDRAVGGRGVTKYSFIDAKNNERRKYKLFGDKAEVYYTDLLKKYPFPEFDGENFITEEVVWNEIAIDGYYLRWFSDIIYICDYLEGGLTQAGNQKFVMNPRGVLYWAKLQLKAFPHDVRMLAFVVDRCCVTFENKKSKKEIADAIGINVALMSFAVFLNKIKKIIRRNK